MRSDHWIFNNMYIMFVQLNVSHRWEISAAVGKLWILRPRINDHVFTKVNKACSCKCNCCRPLLTWSSGVSAREIEVGGHWDTLSRSSSTSSWCKVSCEVPGSCRAITMALVLSARNIRWRHRSRAWLTSCLALDTPHCAYSMKVCCHSVMGP